MCQIIKFMFDVFVFTAVFADSKAQLGGLVAIPSSSKIDDNLHEDSSVLSAKQLDTIYGVVKNISHSRGPVVKSKEGDYQYRRSFTAKVENEVNTRQLRSTIAALKENVSFDDSSKPSFIENLYFLENIVHQYDMGKKFVDIAGFNFILSLTMHKDDDVSNAAFIVLSAAMQSNVDVQNHALATNLMKIINETVQLQLYYRLNSALLSLSAFIRNHPKSLEVFILNRGIYMLSSVIDNQFKITKTYLRVINILNDITVELLGHHQPQTVMPVNRIFIEQVQQSSLCEKIVDLFSVSDEYIADEKIGTALKNMFDVCGSTFIKKQLNNILETKMREYDPQKHLNMWYPPVIDLELRHEMYQEMKILSKRLSKKKVSKKYSKRTKNEL